MQIGVIVDTLPVSQLIRFTITFYANALKLLHILKNISHFYMESNRGDLKNQQVYVQDFHDKHISCCIYVYF